MDGKARGRVRWYSNVMKIKELAATLRWYVVVKLFRFLCVVFPAGVSEWFASRSGLKRALGTLLADPNGE